MTELILVSYMLAALAATQCPIAEAGFETGNLSGPCDALLVHDDGSGPQLYAAGKFERAGSVSAHNVARWNGASWSPVDGLNDRVRCLRVFDDGAGAQLYAGGEFTQASGSATSRVARWDGVRWHPLGEGLYGPVHALAVFNDGSGPALYAGGEFASSGATPMSSIARWDGASWSALGSGITTGAFPGIVRALAVYDDGTGAGPVLYAAGRFIAAGGVTVTNVARWNGASWSDVGGGLDGYGGGASVYELSVFDEGLGPRLFASGAFTMAGGQAALTVARWDGSAWCGTGLVLPIYHGESRAMAVLDDGIGPALFVATTVAASQPQPRSRVHRWDGQQWHTIGTDQGFVVEALGPKPTRTGLCAGGWFAEVSLAGSVSELTAGRWLPLDGGLGATDHVHASALFDFGAGPELVVAGEFASIAGESHSLVHWTGERWDPIGTLNAFPVVSLATFDADSGAELYAGSDNPTTYIDFPRLHRWNGTGWLPVPRGPSAAGSSVHALAVFDDGSGSALYVGGDLPPAGTPSLDEVLRFDGASWSSVGAAFDGDVSALTVFDDGSGEMLYAGGRFSSNGGTPMLCVARWNGSTWRPVGIGMTWAGAAFVQCFAVHDDGSGPKLHAAGRFTMADGMPAASIARWTGSAWEPLGAGLTLEVRALASFDAGDGIGARLYAGGTFVSTGGMTLNQLARWNGASWQSVGAGIAGPNGERAVSTLQVHDDGHGPALWVGGAFSAVDNVTAGNLAPLRSCGSTGAPFCAGDGSASGCPCGNQSPIGIDAGCVNSTGFGALLRASGLASVTDDTLVLVGNEMTNGAALYFQGTDRVNGGAGTVFGDGLRCAGGSVRRLDVVANSAGASEVPQPGDPSISILGVVEPGRAYAYQVWFRDAQTFCTSATWNLSNGLTIWWNP